MTKSVNTNGMRGTLSQVKKSHRKHYIITPGPSMAEKIYSWNCCTDSQLHSANVGGSVQCEEKSLVKSAGQPWEKAWSWLISFTLRAF